jgi:hypothetical protein
LRWACIQPKTRFCKRCVLGAGSSSRANLDDSSYRQELRVRYPVLPQSLTEFLAGLKVCANVEQTAWFLCQDDFAGCGDSAWHWDEFERMLLEWAETGQERNAVVAFWNSHFPFSCQCAPVMRSSRCAWVRADKVIK